MLFDKIEILTFLAVFPNYFNLFYFAIGNRVRHKSAVFVLVGDHLLVGGGPS